MENTYLYVKVDGSVSRVEIPSSNFNAEVHKYIDCSIYELVRVPGNYYLIVDENGKMYDEPKPVNIKASMLYPGTPYGDPIVGDVLIGFLGRVNGEPDMVGLDEADIDMLELFFSKIDSVIKTGNTGKEN